MTGDETRRKTFRPSSPDQILKPMSNPSLWKGIKKNRSLPCKGAGSNQKVPPCRFRDRGGGPSLEIYEFGERCKAENVGREALDGLSGFRASRRVQEKIMPREFLERLTGFGTASHGGKASPGASGRACLDRGGSGFLHLIRPSRQVVTFIGS